MFGRNPSSSSLAMRDSAAAAYFGVRAEDDYGADFGHDRMGYAGSFGYSGSFGADGAAPAAPVPAPQSHDQMMQVWQEHHQKKAHTAARTRLLQPNAGSDVDVNRYRFPLNQTITLGTALSPFTTWSSQPDTWIRPERITINAPSMAFILVSEIKAGNVAVTIGGSAVFDAYELNPNSVDQGVDLPLLGPQTKVTIAASYTGFLPPGFTGGTSYTAVATFTGWATIKP